MYLMTQNGHQHEMLNKNTFVSWDWTLGVNRSQAYPSLSCSKLITHWTLRGCIIVICFDECGWGIHLKNDAAAGTSISKRSEQMFLIVYNEAWYSLPTQWLDVGLDDFASLVLLELKRLEEVNKYSSPSSLLVVT
jgi:hypothetical protein